MYLQNYIFNIYNIKVVSFFPAFIVRFFFQTLTATRLTIFIFFTHLLIVEAKYIIMV